MLVHLIKSYVGLALQKVLFKYHIDHEQKVLMNILTNMLQLHLKLLYKILCEHFYKGLSQYKSDLQLSHKEHHSQLVNIGLLQNMFIIIYSQLLLYFLLILQLLYIFNRISSKFIEVLLLSYQQFKYFFT